MEQPDASQGSASSAVDKALDVLFLVGTSAQPQGVSEIGRALGLPKSSAHRLLAALKRRDLVEQDASGRYRAGAGLLGLTGGQAWLRAARPALEQGARALGETFFYVSARDGALVVLDKVEGTGMLRGSPAVGGVVPVHATAVGKLYLAFAPGSVRLDDPLPRYTARTIVEPERLEREVRRARAQRTALSHAEWIDGLSVAAAPVFDGERLIGAVCAAVPSVRLTELGDRVLTAVEQASTVIGASLRGPR